MLKRAHYLLIALLVMWCLFTELRLATAEANNRSIVEYVNAFYVRVFDHDQPPLELH